MFLFFSGSDLFYFLQDIVLDFQDLAGADIVSLGLRVLVVFFGVVLLVGMIKVLWRIFWDTFGKMFYWLGRMITAPYRVPRDAVNQYAHRMYERNKQRRYKKQAALEKIQREQQAAEKAKREQEAFERIMK